MFGLNPRANQEISEALKHPDVTVEEILKCNGVTSLFRNNHPELSNFFLQEKNAKKLIEIIKYSDDKKLKNIVLTLFQSGNTSLYRIFADNLNITEYAFDCLDENTSSNLSNYNIGILSRLISHAFDLWPEDMSEICRLSPNILKKIIIHLDNICIFQTVQDLITAKYHGLWLFLWCCFKAILPPGANDYQLPKKKALVEIYQLDIDPSLITKVHRIHILKFLRLFFHQKFPWQDEFEENVIKFIVREKELDEHLLYLSAALPANKEILERAIKIIKEEKSQKSEIIERAVEYVSYASELIDNDTVLSIISILLSSSDYTNFSFLAAKELLLETIEKFNDEAVMKLKKLLAETYNKSKNDNSEMRVSFAISFASIVPKDKNDNSQWMKFMESVVYPFIDYKEIDHDFLFGGNFFENLQ
ncbi:hypothetical protein GPJ56_004872 [Histomonas meleagridis]|uniref:uncharacterized protein n=1 Tax=Histomonas meleagridis TaxID=135588 RepID=UPI00355A51BD|nr:hypothetical protein GPJ56_004872 [Histomonas meleagridis]KAH0803522.1 hypothetical protein GO595_003866 [Histomonas meleagridis]